MPRASMKGKVSTSILRSSAPPWQLLWLVILFFPLGILVLASLRSEGPRTGVLWLGAVFQLFACMLALLSRQSWRDVTGAPTIMIYFIALSWLVLGGAQQDWFFHLALAVLMVVPLILFALHCLYLSGAMTLRRARYLADQLAQRQTWPEDLMSCRSLAEVKALRENLHLDASPALLLLQHPRVEVKVAGLASLEFRQSWQPGHAEAVLHLARHTQEPAVRASAVLALGNIEDRLMMESLCEYLWDPSPLARQAAKEAILWNLEQRWPWIRISVRQALAHPLAQHDGALCREQQLLPEEVLADLTAWAAEKSLLAMRAAITLAAHYHHALLLGNDSQLASTLRRQVASPSTPALLRLELARLLFSHRELDVDTSWQLLDGSIPAPIRLLAAETLVQSGHSLEVTPVLHELARTPNREIALATADVVQRCLGIDLGMPRDAGIPPLHSRQAVELVRRLLVWANETDPFSQPDAIALRGDAGWRPPQ